MAYYSNQDLGRTLQFVHTEQDRTIVKINAARWGIDNALSSFLGDSLSLFPGTSK